MAACPPIHGRTPHGLREALLLCDRGCARAHGVRLELGRRRQDARELRLWGGGGGGGTATLFHAPIDERRRRTCDASYCARMASISRPTASASACAAVAARPSFCTSAASAALASDATLTLERRADSSSSWRARACSRRGHGE